MAQTSQNAAAMANNSGVFVSTYHRNQQTTYYLSAGDDGTPQQDYDILGWQDGRGGTENQFDFEDWYPDMPRTWVTQWPTSSWPMSPPNGMQTYTVASSAPTTNVVFSPILPWEHCDTNGYVPYVNVRRTADTEINLSTGGPAGSTAKNLWVISASATDTTTGIPYDQIEIGSYGTLDADGNLWVVLPDNQDLDVTPFVKGKDFLTFTEPPPTKYLSHFGVFVNMPDPGGTANYTGSGFSRNYGHAWWCLSSDAPADAIVQQLKAAGLNSNSVNQLNVQEGYGPVGDLTLVYSPFDLVAPGEVIGSSGDNTNRTYEIGFYGLLGGLNSAQYLSDHPGTYGARNNNCAEEVESLGALVGVPLPNTRYPEVLGHQLPPNN
jgi:hypothetical protein